MKQLRDEIQICVFNQASCQVWDQILTQISEQVFYQIYDQTTLNINQV